MAEGERCEPKVPPQSLRDSPVVRARGRARVCERVEGRPAVRPLGRRVGGKGSGWRAEGVVTGTNGPRPRKRCRQRARRCAPRGSWCCIACAVSVAIAAMRDLKARLHHVGRNDASRRVTSRFGSDENDDPRTAMTMTTTANGRWPTACSGSSNCGDSVRR